MSANPTTQAADAADRTVLSIRWKSQEKLHLTLPSSGECKQALITLAAFLIPVLTASVLLFGGDVLSCM